MLWILLDLKVLREKDMIMKYLLPIVYCLMAFCQAHAQLSFDVAAFTQKQNVVEWLLIYDRVAWVTSDSVMAEDPAELEQLGGEWFCFQDADNRWHAVYGKDVDGHFQSVFHYLVDGDGDGDVRRLKEPLDSGLVNPLSRALVHCRAAMTAYQDSVSIRFNQYIRQQANGEIEVWILPAFQPNGVAIYGWEFYWKLDKWGQKVIEQTAYTQTLRGFEVGEKREIWLTYSTVDAPTLGGVFFVEYYQPYFTRINLETATSRSFLMSLGESDGGSHWIHVEKDLSKGKKKKRKQKKKKKN